jgi:imidazolonepropionase-like amidohydrolase
LILSSANSGGAIEKGKLADLVLFDASLLTDISNKNKINAVVLNGRLLDRKTVHNTPALSVVSGGTSKAG